ncbi:MAG: ACT domain-containing protein [Anaerolineales bacterium]|nr:ACT domain-containing protein [Anaerolineales bacterium]
MEHNEGETDLQSLLKQMQPVLDDEQMVFCSLPTDEAEKYLTSCQGYYREQEGVSLIIDKRQADLDNLTYGPVFRRISLMVHSSLEAVGFLSRIAEILAAQGISVNVVSGYFHDYLYINVKEAENAVMILELWQEKLNE